MSTPADDRDGDDCGADVCITCGDVAVALTVIGVEPDGAQCIDTAGRTETVAIDLVGPVSVGERLLVHAGVALARWEAP